MTSNADQPLVSVVMPVFNAAASVAEAIASVQAQSWRNWEILAVNDASSDASARILADLSAQDKRITVLDNHGEHGAGATRNIGISAAKGRYIAFLDADDLWHPEKLTRQIGFMQSGGHVLCCTAYLRRNMVTGRESVIGVPARISRSELLLTNWIACSSAVYDRDHFHQRYMPHLKRRQDYAFWLALLENDQAAGLDEVLMTYRQQPVSVSSSKIQAGISTWKMYRGHLKLSVPRTLWCFGNYAVRGLARHRALGLARRAGWLHPARQVDCPELTVAIATLGNRVFTLTPDRLPEVSGVRYAIFAQDLDSAGLARARAQLSRADISVNAADGRGAARSRNAALAATTTELLLFADDDLVFLANNYAALRDRFAQDAALDFVCGRVDGPDGRPRKSYGADGQRVSRFNAGRVGTPELAVRPARIRAAGLRFDENFGAGTKLFLGDEFIFLSDALRAGLTGQHIDLTLAVHPAESSGTTQGPEALAIRKAVISRAMGSAAIPARLAFALKHRRKFTSLGMALRFILP